MEAHGFREAHQLPALPAQHQPRATVHMPSTPEPQRPWSYLGVPSGQKAPSGQDRCPHSHLWLFVNQHTTRALESPILVY